MSLEEVLSFIAENPICTIATVEGDQPRVRGFLSVLFGDGAIYFTTAATKKVYKQLAVNPKVELCYLTRDYGRMMRLTGEVEIIDDREKKEKLIAERSYLAGFSASSPDFILLRISNGKARFWTIQDNLKEDQLEVVEF